MLIEMNRFFRKEEIERLYQIPPELLSTVMANVWPVHRDETGESYFVESDVDRAVDAFAAKATGRQRAASDPAPRGKPGRRNDTADIAHCANELKTQGMTWKEILGACKGQFPGRVKNVEQVRTIWRRHYGGKKT